MSAAEEKRPEGDTTVVVKEKTEEQQPGIREDLWKIVRLGFLYALLGIPIGLIGVIARLHKNGGVGRIELVMLFAPWAFTWKLFWIPFLNNSIIHSIGRCLSWTLAGFGQFILIIILSLHAIENGGSLNVPLLSIVFPLMYYLVAIQTIEVHNWASTILQPCHLKYNPICNIVGQNAGYYLVLFAWKSLDFRNKYLRTAFLEEGINILAIFLLIFGSLFFSASMLVAVFKINADREPTAEDELKMQDLWKLPQSSQVQKFAGFLLVYILFTLLTSVGRSNQPEKICYMMIIMLTSTRIFMMLVKCLTRPELEDISGSAIPYRFVIFNMYFFVLIALVFSNFSLTIRNFLVVLINHLFYNKFLCYILRTACATKQEVNKTYEIFLTTLLGTADELYCFCLSSLISYTMQLDDSTCF
ncbi:acetyl-coenzyme A transporter 1-like [Drosophila takahashii]|uniref:acetyl-coenzyme A transporter 1-like n=1 Tax=Drosophila takahashii TaxID=29030 RepID=UPI001CF8C270|nr:acetyl-coenzyme A transporter 1-like [Drosophila takahashii]